LAIRAELAKNYEKYEQGGQLSLQEMLKQDRLKKMLQRIEFLMNRHYGDIAQNIENALGGAYTDGYHMTAWAVETSAKTSIGYAAVRPETLTAMLQNPIKGLTLKARLQMRRARIIQAIQQQVTQGLQKNESYSTMAKRLKSELEGDAVKAMRIVRTEGHRVQESAKHDAMEFANGNGVIMMKQWNTQEDVRVRRKPKNKADHKKLNNKKVPMDGLFDDGLSEGPAPGQLGAAGSDINCRCFLTYSIEKVERREVKDIEKLTFDQWKKEKLN
ncbi:MAG: phage minor head protein, partial [Bacillus sp. (in: firmicutes)]